MHLDGTAAQRRDRLTESVVRMVRRSGQHRFVLLIDQAHRLHQIQYEWLIDLHDEINEAGVDFYVFLIGQRELSAICDELRRSGKTQIIGRFMVDRVEYFGIRTERELQECLACYDERTAFPEGTDWTFTRYFSMRPFPGDGGSQNSAPSSGASFRRSDRRPAGLVRSRFRSRISRELWSAS